MIRRPRVTWLLDSPDPSGSAVMALRRARVLQRQTSGTVLTLSGALGRVPAASPLHGLPRLASLGGELRIARSDVVVTTTPRTLATAAPRLAPNTRLVHFLHERPERALRHEWFMRTMPRVAHVVVPLDVDPHRFAGQAGLAPHQVSTADDFVAPADVLVGSARARVVLAVGRLRSGGAVTELVEGFRLALPDLPGWQLRVAGWGAGLPELVDRIDRQDLGGRVFALGARHDATELYLDAGLVARLDDDDASGLSVHEALAAGVPVLGSAAVPAVRRLVRGGDNGAVLERVDPPAVAAALVALADPDRRATLALKARTERAGLLTDDAADALRRLFATVLDTDVRAADLTSKETAE